MDSKELIGDPKRQAVASLRGAVYQAWCSIEAWLRVRNDEQVIYLEGAEDFDVVGHPTGDVAVQVKHNEGSISLGTAKAREALENHWTLANQEPSRLVHTHYLTTSNAAMERDAIFGGMCGINAWRVARTSAFMARTVANYLVTKLGEESELKHFFETAETSELQTRLFRRFHWFTSHPDIDVVKRSVEDRISVLLANQSRPTSLTGKVQVQLESRFWEVITEQNSSLRRLTLGDLLRQFDSATSTYLPLPVEKIPDLLASAPPGLALLKLLIQKVPPAPSPLISRAALTQRLTEAVVERRPVLLTGTVFKGKTTLAQLVVESHCPDAWWVNLTDRRPDQVDNVLLALAGQIEEGKCPGLVVLDDLDISPAAHRTFQNSLLLVLHRASNFGCGVILTAQGASSESAQFSAFERLEIVDVPELSQEEVQSLCLQHGCPRDDTAFWALTIHVQSRGHPKLVQVRLIELSEQNWPAPSPVNFGMQTGATQTVRQLARQLLSQTVPAEEAEFLYTASESVVPIHRTVAIRLAEAVRVKNAGDAVDRLAGKWLERVEREWYRTTPLLQGAANDAWSPERKRAAHILLHKTLLQKGTLSPSEAAALLFHAFFGQDWGLVAKAALRLQLLDDSNARQEVERNLLWLSYVALEPGQFIAGSPQHGAPLRSLQFRVAVTLNADTLPAICDRWAEEVQQLSPKLLQDGMRSIMWNSICISESAKIPLSHRLSGIKGLSNLTGEAQQLVADGLAASLAGGDARTGIPAGASITQLMLAFTARWIKDDSALRALVTWLDCEATGEIRAEFDSVLNWPLVQTLGAFIQGAWAAQHEDISDWTPWLDLLNDVEEYAIRRVSLRFGREAAKAKATILTEHLERGGDALAVLSSAELNFGKSTVLDEQRANVLFHVKDDEQVLQIWNGLMNSASGDSVLDPFAYRRAAISAYRLNQYTDSAEIFQKAADRLEPDSFAVTKFGLLVDSAHAKLRGGFVVDAAQTLVQAVFSLPTAAASGEGEGQRWEAVQRTASDVCRYIEEFHSKPEESRPKFEPGYASSPSLKVEKMEPGQEGRTLLLRVQAAKLATCHSIEVPGLESQIAHLSGVPYRFVRRLAVEAQIALLLRADAGHQFIDALLAFDQTVSCISAYSGSIVMPDEEVIEEGTPQPERWFGLLVAGAWCSGAQLQANLKAWEKRLEMHPENFPLLENVRLMLQGAIGAADGSSDIAADPNRKAAERCGAAAQTLLQPLSPLHRLKVQGLLASAVVSDGSYMFQEVFNLHLARQVARDWRVLTHRPFLFSLPQLTSPPLIAAIEEVERGCGTLKTILSAAQRAVHLPTPEYMSRLW